MKKMNWKVRRREGKEGKVVVLFRALQQILRSLLFFSYFVFSFSCQFMRWEGNAWFFRTFVQHFPQFTLLIVLFTHIFSFLRILNSHLKCERESCKLALKSTKRTTKCGKSPINVGKGLKLPSLLLSSSKSWYFLHLISTRINWFLQLFLCFPFLYH